MIDKNPAAPEFVDKDKPCCCELCGTCDNAYRYPVAGRGVSNGTEVSLAICFSVLDFDCYHISLLIVILPSY